MAFISTRAYGQLQRRRKGARNAHRTIRTSGRILGPEARAARKRYVAAKCEALASAQRGEAKEARHG